MAKRHSQRGSPSPSARHGNRVRIIGGRHRGRRLPFPDLPGLRPTADRVRETLFNWLQPGLPGAICLDLFAGSGVLGLEAASREAGRVVMLDRAPAVVDQIRENIGLLGLGQATAEQADALAWLTRPGTPFDIVFVDPPFADGLVEPCCQLLERQGWLRPGARIYIERAVAGPGPRLPDSWDLLREKRAGQVSYQLFTQEDPD